MRPRPRHGKFLVVRLLLVDDDAELCGLLGEFLRREGFTLECAHEGRAGLEKAAQPGLDLVVLDVMLPGIDGFEILRRLRQQSQVPVMMLTARGEDVDRIVGLDLSWWLGSARFCVATNRGREHRADGWK